MSVMQNDKVNFSFVEGTYLGIAQAIPSIVGTWGFWRIQRYWRINTKTMVRRSRKSGQERRSTLHTGPVRCHECRYDHHPALGHARDLD